MKEPSCTARREFLKGLAGSVAGFTLLPGLVNILSCAKSDKIRSKPNIIIMVADDTGWCDVGYHKSEIKTPNIDRLVNEGIELDHFYVSPTCSPTRASLLTGRPPSRFGILGPIAGTSKLALPAGTKTLAEIFREHGYMTAITGKWHLGLQPDVGPRKYGFDYTYGYLHGQIDQYTHRYKYGDRTWHRNDEFIDEEGHATDLIANEAINFIKRQRKSDKPFFLYVPFSVPHFPIQEEDRWIDLYKDDIENPSRRLFAASMTHMDDAIGKILGALDSEELRENTLVIFLSDNGGQQNWYPDREYDGKHGPNDALGNNSPLRGWKGSLYEGGIRVPAVMRWTGTLARRRVEHTIAVYDILPTLANLIGAKLTPDQVTEGVDIWPAITGAGNPEERVLYWRTSQQQAIRQKEWKLIHNGDVLSEGAFELYDIHEDPLEENNLASERPEIVAQLKNILQDNMSTDLTGGR